jgi:uncharacterized membrane protein YhaH (DUF805 family)
MTTSQPTQGPAPSRSERAVAAVVLVTYAIVTVLAYRLGHHVLTPCKNNFEGGCDYGKMFAFPASMLLAIGSLACAICLATLCHRHFRSRRRTAATALLGAPAAVYVAYGTVMFCIQVGSLLLGLL